MERNTPDLRDKLETPIHERASSPSVNPPAPVEITLPTGAPPLLKGWLLEDAKRLHRIFTNAESRIKNGQKVRRAFKQQAWFYSKPHFYRKAHARRVRYSYSSLIRRYYRWKNEGRTIEAAALRYRQGPSRVVLPKEQIEEFIRICLAPGGASFRSVYRALPQPVFSIGTYRHAVPEELRKDLIAIFTARRKALRIERKARKVFGRFAEVKP